MVPVWLLRNARVHIATGSVWVLGLGQAARLLKALTVGIMLELASQGVSGTAVPRDLIG